MDMIPTELRAKSKNMVGHALRGAGIPENFITWGEKKCSWDERHLQRHVNTLSQFLAAIPATQDYWEELEKANEDGTRKYPSDLLHIDPAYCKTEMCDHSYTEETKNNYCEFLSAFLR
jgi:hypothetical protein